MWFWLYQSSLGIKVQTMIACCVLRYQKNRTNQAKRTICHLKVCVWMMAFHYWILLTSQHHWEWNWDWHTNYFWPTSKNFQHENFRVTARSRGLNKKLIYEFKKRSKLETFHFWSIILHFFPMNSFKIRSLAWKTYKKYLQVYGTWRIANVQLQITCYD